MLANPGRGGKGFIVAGRARLAKRPIPPRFDPCDHPCHGPAPGYQSTPAV